MMPISSYVKAHELVKILHFIYIFNYIISIQFQSSIILFCWLNTSYKQTRIHFVDMQILTFEILVFHLTSVPNILCLICMWICIYINIYMNLHMFIALLLSKCSKGRIQLTWLLTFESQISKHHSGNSIMANEKNIGHLEDDFTLPF